MKYYKKFVVILFFYKYASFLTLFVMFYSRFHAP